MIRVFFPVLYEFHQFDPQPREEYMLWAHNLTNNHSNIIKFSTSQTKKLTGGVEETKLVFVSVI